jgi:hypothetical protein
VQEHQREQTEIFGLVRHQFAKRPRQADGFRAEFTAHQGIARGCGVSFVEYQVDDRLDRSKTFR